MRFILYEGEKTLPGPEAVSIDERGSCILPRAACERVGIDSACSILFDPIEKTVLFIAPSPHRHSVDAGILRDGGNRGVDLAPVLKRLNLTAEQTAGDWPLVPPPEGWYRGLMIILHPTRSA